ncbi:hypothetical protein IEO21_09707 [Rhodonia placenta]|uniref:Uncharacterized protein n=1 Tax=Rhodonia placenta TaxID=104341 RepID=A0A8H7NTU9_9APHY|nr:hypothetical protein IEO21_09707 [Postia placenta]
MYVGTRLSLTGIATPVGKRARRPFPRCFNRICRETYPLTTQVVGNFHCDVR